MISSKISILFYRIIIVILSYYILYTYIYSHILLSMFFSGALLIISTFRDYFSIYILSKTVQFEQTKLTCLHLSIKRHGLD